MAKEMVIVLDFGGQYNQLIARRVRECNVYCEVLPYTKTLDEIKALNPKALFLQVVRTVFMMRLLLIMKRLFLNLASQSWVSAMVLS